LESKDAQKIKGFIESLHSTGNDGDEIDLWFWKLNIASWIKLIESIRLYLYIYNK
jgi:hypothetical protein